MANNYLLFSVEVPGLTTKEEAWFKKELEPPDKDTFTSWSSAKQRAWLKEHDAEELSYYPDFRHELAPDGQKHMLLLFSDECGSLEQVCSLLQRYLKTFHPNEWFGVEWATTCSKMRPGEFGGGAVFITAQRQQYVNSGTWLHETQVAWERRKKNAATRGSQTRSRARAASVHRT